MPEAFICDGIRTPIGRYGGALAKVRTDDLAAVPIKALMQRYRNVDWEALDEVILGCANQAGEDNRNVGRMAALLAGLPVDVPAATINRLCGSSLDAVGTAEHWAPKDIVAHMTEWSRRLADDLDRARQAAAGVNLDEELAQLLQAQQAYAASATLVRVVNEMLDTLMRGL